MPVHIGFLRAVNLGSTRKFPMADLRAALRAAGFDEVETHINSGNVKVSTSLRSQRKVAAEMERIFEADRGFAVPAIVLSPAELRAIAADAVSLSAEHAPLHGHYVSLLRTAPSDDVAGVLEDASGPGERVVVRGRAVHLLYDVPYHRATMSNSFVEKAIGTATNRNVNVIRKLEEKWSS